MDRFFDLQLFGTLETNTMNSGTKNEHVTVPGSADTASNLSNTISDYVEIKAGSAADVISTTASKHVTISAGGGSDIITATSMQEDLIVDGEGGDDSVSLLYSHDATINGGDGADTFTVAGTSMSEINGDAGADVFNVSTSESIAVNGGADDDEINIGEGVDGITITAGAGNDQITLDKSVKNVVLADLTSSDTLVFSGLTSMPRFAAPDKSNRVLNFDGVQVTLGEDVDWNDIKDVVVQVGDETAKLGNLMDATPPYWEVGLATNRKSFTGGMTYYAADGSVLANVTGLNKTAVQAAAGLEYDNETNKTYPSGTQFTTFDGISVDLNNNIVLSSELIPSTAGVTLDSKDFNLALEETPTTFTQQGMKITGGANAVKTATYVSKVVKNGHYVGDEGKKIKYGKANATVAAFTLGNLVKTTAAKSLSTATTLEGLDFSIVGTSGVVTISDNTMFAGASTARKATINGEDVTFVFEDSDNYLKSLVGSAVDDHVDFTGVEDGGTTINLDKGNDWLTLAGSAHNVNLGDGNDYLFGDYNKSKVNAGAGNDYIELGGISNSIVAGAGNDTIEISSSSYSTVNAAAGADFVSFTLSDTDITSSSINLGDGNDSVAISLAVVDEDGFNEHHIKDVKIDAGKGDDYLNISNASDVQIVSAEGNNKVTFSGMSSTISLGKGADVVSIDYTYDSQVYLGAGKDELNIFAGSNNKFDAGAANDVINIAGEDGSTVRESTILAGAGADEINITAQGYVESTLIDAGADGDFILVSDTAMTGSTISGGLGNDKISIVSSANSEAGNTYYYGYGNGNDTIFGITEFDNLVLAARGGDDKNYTIGSVSSVEIVTGKDDDGNDVKETFASVDISVGEGNMKGGVTLVFNNADTETAVASINDIVSTGHALESQINWSVSGGTATGKMNGKTVATITGLKKASSTKTGTAKTKDLAEQNAAIAAALSDDGDVIYISDAAITSASTKVSLKTGSALGYKIALGADVTAYNAVDNGWDVNTDTKVAVCKGTTQTAGYILDDDVNATFGTKITFKGIDEGVINPTVTGFSANAEESDFTLSGTTVIISKGALDDYTADTDTGISISGKDYKLALNTDEESSGKVAISTVDDATWQFDVDGLDSDEDLTAKASYVSPNTTAGYYITGDGTGIGYRKAEGSDTLVTVCGLKLGTEAADLSVSNDNVITVSSKAVTKEKTTIYIDDDGATDYTLALGSGLTAAKLKDAGFTYSTASGGTASYQTRQITKDGYALSEDKKAIDWYSKEDETTTVFKLSGVSKKASVKGSIGYEESEDVDGNVTHYITVNGDALNKKDISVEAAEGFEDENFVLSLNSTVAAPDYTAPATWATVSGGVKYLTAKNTEGYTLNEDTNTIEYTAASIGKTAISITGLSSSVGVTNDGAVEDGVITFTAVEGSTESDTVVLKTSAIKDASTKGTVGASITGATYKYQLDGTGGKVVYNKGTGTQITGSDGKDSLYGGTGKDTLYGGKDADYLNGGVGNDYLSGDDGDDILVGGNGKDILIGGAGENNLSGGNGNDTLTAGVGGDTTAGINVLTGGAGNDLFIHLGGKTTITDYAAGADKIQIASDTSITGTVSGKDVVFTLAEGNTITVKNGKNKWITLTDGTETKKKKGVVVSDSGTLWFEDESEFASADNLSNITDSDLVGEFENYDSGKLNKQENLVTYGE